MNQEANMGDVPQRPETVYRGSRKHVLDWVSVPTFPQELLELALPVGCSLRPDSQWMPVSLASPLEARLEHFGRRVMPDRSAWEELASWWHLHRRGANTPNWDIAMNCNVEGQHGLILVEAKANIPELSAAGKAVAKKPSERSCENSAQIAAAIEEARMGLSKALPGITIGVKADYQLSNRLAFSWKLATLGFPTVLIYPRLHARRGHQGRWRTVRRQRALGEGVPRASPSGVSGSAGQLPRARRSI